MQDTSQITKLNYANSQYPLMLREIKSPPKSLYLKGQLLTDKPLIAIVGSRHPTSYGRDVTYRLAGELAAAGIGIVSGLAIGIDAVAHEAALEAGGYTIAVLGCGLDQMYPPRNRRLAARILKAGGALLSEQPEGMPALPHHFPARNRIIAGLCVATLVTEAAASSGSLITANFALEASRELMAVPGNITSPASAGPNNLIREGAKAVVSAADVLADLNLQSDVVQLEAPQPKSKEEATILQLLDEGVTASHQLIDRSGLGASEFAQTISLMEITGKVRNLGAGTWVKRR